MKIQTDSRLKALFLSVIAVSWLFASCSSTNEAEKAPEKKIKVVLDIDTGIDDAMALAYALGSPQVELLGVVGSYGNVTLEQGLQNSLNLLNFLGRPDVPVYPGASHALHFQGDYEPSQLVKEIHGENGIGNVSLPVSPRKVEKENAVDYLIRMADRHKQELTVVAVGPLTNLANAMVKDPTFEEKVGRIVIMGGALTVPGNCNPYAEANIQSDPFAARRVLKSKAQVTMVGLDVTHRTLLNKEETAQWRALKTPAGMAFADMADYCIDISLKLAPDIKGCPLHDPLAMGVAVDPSLVRTFDLNLEVGTGKEDYGRTIGDQARLLDEHPNVSVCIDVDHKTFNRRFFEVLYGLFKPSDR